ncbi:hypothetical protein SteCoe_6958 [Stentor coeruleus]|uniref:DUF1704 domain-containing protein n=1 Tax=Stentor coeruleus TaxID=5963 RepID=A0A1R2CNV0_9CILI|nr:hypothetical protein SteCoe_6958 [Stentor coeruleus]
MLKLDRSRLENSRNERRSQSSKLPPINRKKPSITHIGKVSPNNILEQQDYFFKNNCAVNPIFSYPQGSSQSEYINKFKVSSKYLAHAIKILDNCLMEFKSETNYFETDGGRLLNEKETVDCFEKYMNEHGLNNMMSVVFSSEAIAPTTINYYPKTHKCVATVSLPIFYRENRISGVLHHEIGTHLIRSLNDRKQIWANKRKKYGLRSFVETEEGLATIHTNIESAFNQNRKPYLWSAALHYYASYQASILSFSDLYADLSKYIDDPNKRFKETLRVKRGMTDTSKPGGCYKDQVYLSGAIKILQSRWRIDFKELCSGKIALEDYFREDIRKSLKFSDLIYPDFMKDMELYRRALDNIAKTNGIDLD